MSLADLKFWFGLFVQSERGRFLLKWARIVFLMGILGYLALKLSEIGWMAVWEALPTHPLFYLFFLLLYVSLPLTEMLIYRVTWRYDVRRSLPAFFKKRVYNRDVMGYAGEVYFFAWARKNVDLNDKEIAKTVRDNNIISSAASTLIALVLLGVFLYIGYFRITDLINDQVLSYLIGGGLLVAVLIPLGLRFRKYIFSMALSTTLLIFAIQCGRLLVGQVLQISQWAVVMPDVNLSVWFTFAAVSIILTRIPFIPNQSLIFLGVGVELSSTVGIPEAAMFSMLGVLAALDKLLNFGLLAFMAFQRPDKTGEKLQTAEEGDALPAEAMVTVSEEARLPLNT